MNALEPPSVRSEAVGWTAFGLLAAGGAAALFQRGLGIGPPNCLLRTTIGHPCPMCGLSTVGVHLLRLDLVGALRLDPVGAVLLVALVVLGGLQLFRTFVRPIADLRWPVALVIPVALLVAHWALTLGGVVDLAPLR